MVFIRVKKVKGLDYYYLVKSQWDPKSKRSTQHTIKYLGNPSNFTIDDIPLEYRTNPKVVSMLFSSPKEQEKNLLKIEKSKKQVLTGLKNGKVDEIIKIAKKYKAQKSLGKFYDDVLKNAMYEVGYLWQQNKLDVGMEHICSNTAIKAIDKITEPYKKPSGAYRIVLCTPHGELHNISCSIIESVLLEKGFKVYNISPSAPTDSTIAYIKDTKPTLILISVTLLDNMGSASRLVKKIGTHNNIPILIGGLAINNSSDNERNNVVSLNPNVKLILNSKLDELVQIIKDITKNNCRKEIELQT